mmetsp:Transcript_97659/g.209548  ORF Transcript_97659/g.209548 Transcript_97659/m.209548 type:complete len:337 (+) Transcript_97659:120-1130(+)
MGNSALTTCKKFLIEEAICLYQERPDGLIQNAGYPPLRLRVDWNPIRESMGTLLSPFSLTDELVVEALDIRLSKGWEVLTWRHDRHQKESQLQGKVPFPQGPRFSVPKRYTRAKIGKSWYLLQVAIAPEERIMERVKEDIVDAKDVASYAHSFNTHLVRASGGNEDTKTGVDEDQVPRVMICAPVAVSVIESTIPQIVGGEVMLLCPLPAEDLRKFVFDGSEDFLEMPQAFFHYSTWFSGGREMLFDLQGAESDDGDVLLVDPCVLRAPKPGVVDMLRPLVESKLGVQGQGDPDLSEERFDMLHRRCGPLCKTFDPDRKGARGRKMCGLGCGMVGQ